MSDEASNHEAPWRRRFKAPRTTLPAWADDAPERLLYASNETGKFELYSWDRATDARRQLTDRREGTVYGQLEPDGDNVWWFDDTDGDEFGRWLIEPFTGGEATPAADSLGRAYTTGLSLGRTLAVIGRSTEDGGSIDVR